MQRFVPYNWTAVLGDLIISGQGGENTGETAAAFLTYICGNRAFFDKFKDAVFVLTFQDSEGNVVFQHGNLTLDKIETMFELESVPEVQPEK